MYDCNFDQAFPYLTFSLDPISQPQARPANGKRGFWSKDAFDSLESFHSLFMDITHIISWSATLSQFGLLSTGM